MSLSSRIKTIIASAEAQTIVKGVGVESIDFIEPLVGVINRKTMKKTMIYRFTSGVSCAVGGDSSIQIERIVTRKMEDIFLKNDIVPGDFSFSQILQEIDPQGRVIYHLIDSEFFFKKQKTATIS